MIVAEHSRKRLSAAAKAILDIERGDWVRRVGYRRVGVVERVANLWAEVLWSDGTKTDHPLASLRKIKSGGSDLDRRDG